MDLIYSKSNYKTIYYCKHLTIKLLQIDRKVALSKVCLHL